MIALISPAKSMRHNIPSPIVKGEGSEPRFMEQTNYITSLMLQYSSAELEEIFKISHSIAIELKYRFTDLYDENRARISAIDGYDGVVYKHFKDKRRFSNDDLAYLQKHLRISSLLYGLLRPMDMIKPYRMEGFVRLAGSDERVDRYWRDIQTKTLINDVLESGGTLLYLASKEEQSAFHWKEVTKAVNVIDFHFLQRKNDKLRQVVIYTKMARGEMIRYMMDNNITDTEKLKSFEWGGYKYSKELSTDSTWVWIL